ncbi:RraA family protein [Flagellimonas aequoris]|uniref:RraA family protein n=1 Tax=Flagellimonas aequoris TaxID=2306997 RepID=A0A418N9N9_9FLAO|nr:RraA family protein [Allomuricauda aequoris]RIV72378.1 RraA family protein [Allomuricauda aequoris]TXK04404.1 RraA family protein [Allomuricauda aequoris]
MKKAFMSCIAIVCTVMGLQSQNVVWQPETIKALTSEWTGERTSDGRPKVSDELLERLKALSMEEVWGNLKRNGYSNQFENFASTYENGWEILHPDQVMTGRVVTAQFMPFRKDFDTYIQKQAEKEGTKTPVTNYAPIIKLMDGDVYVADSYGKMIDGTLIGDNLGNAIYKAGKRGVIFNGSVRDVEGLSQIEGFNAWIRGSDPSAIKEMMIESVNGPIRIGRVTVLPGDVVLAKSTGVSFIPAHLVQQVVISGEYTALRDEFNRFCMRTNKYEYVNERFVVDDAVFEKDFKEWLDKYPNLPMPKKELDAFLKEREEKRSGN